MAVEQIRVPRPLAATVVATALVLGYVLTVLVANVVTTGYGLVPAGFGLLVPAGSYCAGLALALRDGIQERAGLRWVWAGIAAGTVLSVLLADGRIALASGVAFAVSELLDLLVYTKLRERGWRRALLASNAVGAVVDTALFLVLAGFPLTAQNIGGQVLVKAVWVTVAALVLAEGIRRLSGARPR